MGTKEFAKNITRKRIKGIVEEFIGGRRKGIAPNHIVGQMKSAIESNILSVDECQKIIEDVKEDIEANRLFPILPKEIKLERLNVVVGKLGEQEWWKTKKITSNK